MACGICEKITARQAHIVYEDELVVGILPSRPGSAGHIKVMPKQHFTKLDEMEESLVERMFMVANYASAALFDTLKSHGTNIILNEGQEHMAVDVLSRKEGDGLKFSWNPKQMTPAEYDEAFSKIKDKAFLIGGKPEKKPAVEGGKQAAEVIKVKSMPQPPPPNTSPAKKPVHNESPEKAEQVPAPPPKEPEPEEEKVDCRVKHLTKIP